MLSYRGTAFSPYPSLLADLEQYEKATPQSPFESLPGGVSATDRYFRLSKLDVFNQAIGYEPGDITQSFHLLKPVDVAIGNEPSFFENMNATIIPGGDYPFLSRP